MIVMSKYDKVVAELFPIRMVDHYDGKSFYGRKLVGTKRNGLFSKPHAIILEANHLVDSESVHTGTAIPKQIAVSTVPELIDFLTKDQELKPKQPHAELQ
jgi:hypothetical protein